MYATEEGSKAQEMRHYILNLILVLLNAHFSLVYVSPLVNLP